MQTEQPGRHAAARGAVIAQVLRALLLLCSLHVASTPAAAKEAACPLAAPGTSTSTPSSAGTATEPAWARAQLQLAADELRVCADGRLLLSLREASVRSLRQEFPGEWPFLAVSYEVRALSLAGPYLSVEERRSTENPATYLRERVRVYDLRTPGREVTLDELFPDPALKQALLRDMLVQQATGRQALGRAAAATSSSRALARQLADAPATDRQGRPFLPPGWLGGFWFAGLRGAQLEIGLALPQFSGMREETLLRSTLRLPRPAASTAWPAGVGPAPVPNGWARWAYTERP